jgi:F-type H+-transporting ATPase subunit a
VFGLEFPPINALLRWEDLFPTFNKIALIAVAAALIGSLIFLLAGNKDGTKAPKGVRNLAEVIVEFIEDQIVMPTMGRAGLGWTPFMISLFIFIYLCNVPGVIPLIQMPATARIAIPLSLALLVWVIFIVVGLKHQGLAYFGHLIWPPGVPTALKPLVGVIEFISTIFIRPFSHTVRLMANMMAGAHPARDVRPPDRGARPGRDEPLLLHPAGRPALRHAPVPDPLRGVGRVPAGLHLHDPRRRVHRLLDGGPRRRPRHRRTGRARHPRRARPRLRPLTLAVIPISPPPTIQEKATPWKQ